MNATFDELKTQVVEAFEACDWSKAEKVIQLARDKAEWEQRLATVKGETGPAKHRPLRRIVLRVSFGCPKYSYLLVSRAVQDGFLRTGESMKIRIPTTGAAFEGRVEKNKTVNAKRQFGEFYKKCAVEAGDFVVLQEVAAGEWTLEKANRRTVSAGK